MSKASIVPDLAYTSRKGRRGSQSSGYKELKAVLKYLQYRDNSDGHIPQEEGLERWQDRGLGLNYREILDHCDRLGSKSVLAWTLVVSPAPDLMALVPEQEREALVMGLTEEIVEAYYATRKVEVAEYSYVLHNRLTQPSADNPDRIEQLHTHVVLTGTVPTIEGRRENFYNQANKGHIQMLQDLSTAAFEAALDRSVGPTWRELRPEPEVLAPPIQPEGLSELDQWFGPRQREID